MEYINKYKDLIKKQIEDPLDEDILYVILGQDDVYARSTGLDFTYKYLDGSKELGNDVLFVVTCPKECYMVSCYVNGIDFGENNEKAKLRLEAQRGPNKLIAVEESPKGGLLIRGNYLVKKGGIERALIQFTSMVSNILKSIK